MRVVVEVRADHRQVGVAQHAFQRAVGCCDDCGVHLVNGCRFAGFKRQVHNRHVGRWHADRDAVQFAVQL